MFRNIKPWPGDVKQESEFLPKCCEGHNLEYTDLILDGDGSINTKKMLCIHYRDFSSKEDKSKEEKQLKQIKLVYPGNPLAISYFVSF